VDRTELPRADLIVSGASELITCVSLPDDPLGRVRGGVVAVAGDRIIDVGPAETVARRVDLAGALVVDAAGGMVAPGFIDCHTHLVFGGSRVEQYAATESV